MSIKAFTYLCSATDAATQLHVVQTLLQTLEPTVTVDTVQQGLMELTAFCPAYCSPQLTELNEIYVTPLYELLQDGIDNKEIYPVRDLRAVPNNWNGGVLLYSEEHLTLYGLDQKQLWSSQN